MARPKRTYPATDIAEKIAIAERVLRHTFTDKNLLVQALTHPSAINDREAQAYYERLEFLGDSLLGFIVAEEVFRRFPDMPEGGMTRIKISVVNGRVLSKVASDLGLTEAMILGESLHAAGGRGLRSVLENTFEALTAALYLDAGLRSTKSWIARTLGPLIDAETAATSQNPKSVLQEICQAHGRAPAYRITSCEGPPHDRSFTAAVELEGEVIGCGEGRTKRDAQAAAASAALEHLDKP